MTQPSDAPAWDQPLSWSEIRSMRKARTETVWVPLNAEIMERVEALEKRVKIEERLDEREHRSPVAPGLQRELDALIVEAESAAVPFKLQELPRRVYRALIDAHPARDEDRARRIVRWNEASFVPALIAATCAEPQLTTIPRADFLQMIESGASAADLREHIGPALEVWDEWAASIAYSLFTSAYNLQEGGASVPFTVRRSSEIHDLQPSSTTAPNAE